MTTETAPAPRIRQTPWFGVGTDISEAGSLEAAMKLSGLDWTPELQPIKLPSGKTIDGRFAVVNPRLDQAMGIVKSRYVPYSNADSFGFVQSLVDDGIATLDWAGELRGGSQVFVTAKLTEGITVLGEDPHDVYLLLRNSHDGTRRIMADLTPIRAFCTNQSQMIANTAHARFAVSHTASANERMRVARDVIDSSLEGLAEFKQTAERLAAIDLTLAEVTKVLDESVGATAARRAGNETSETRLADRILGNLQHTDTLADEQRLTGWGVVNALTEHMDHQRTYRTPSSRMLAITDGRGSQLRQNLVSQLLAA